MTDTRRRHDIPADTYIDPIAVERACKGDLTVNLTRLEVAAAVAHLTGKGLNFLQTAKVLGLSDRTVYRIVHGHTAVPCARPGRAA
jgi:hypothetical protein